MTPTRKSFNGNTETLDHTVDFAALINETNVLTIMRLQTNLFTTMHSVFFTLLVILQVTFIYEMPIVSLPTKYPLGISFV